MPVSAAAAQDARAEITSLLERRARAVMDGDRAAFRRTMADAPDGFLRARLDWFDQVRALPIASYELALDRDSYDDLSAAAASLPAADEVIVAPVTERMALRGFDRFPAAETLVLTFTRTGTRWSIAGDDALADLGILSARSIWDFGPVRTVERGAVLAVTRSDVDTASRLAAGVDAAIDVVTGRWPLSWQERGVLLVARSSTELGRIFQTTVDLAPFVAFASHSVDRRADGTVRPGAPRVYIQPDTYFAEPSGFQAEVLSHEMLHVAAGGRAGPFTPAWLEEGVAVVYGESGAPAADRLAAAVRSGRLPPRLPEVHEFFLGSSDDIKRSYEASASFVAFARERYGDDAPARFYARLGRESSVQAGMPRYHLNTASRSAFGRSFDAVERAWLRHIRARFG